MTDKLMADIRADLERFSAGDDPTLDVENILDLISQHAALRGDLEQVRRHAGNLEAAIRQTWRPEVKALRAENERQVRDIEKLLAENEQWRKLPGVGVEASLLARVQELRAENEQLREECRLAAELQIRTGQEADAENERLQAAREQDRELADRLLKFANDEIERLRAALEEACDELENMVSVDDEVTTAWRALLASDKRP